MRIKGWLADHSGCGWYRVVVPLGQLRQMGHDTSFDNKITQRDMDEPADVLVGQRICMPAPTLRWQELASRPGRDYLMVMDIDDDLWSVDSRNPAARVFAEPEIRQRLTRNVQMADLVTVSTDPLAEVVRRYNSNVAVLPNSIPSDWLHWRPGRQLNTFTIGWQGGPTHDRDWETAAEPIRRWFTANRKTRPIEMHSVGSLPDHFPDLWPHRHTDWYPEIPRYYRSLDWDVALAPLAPTRFNRSKSPLRALEAGMLGFPVVASNVEAYGGYVEHGVTGLLVDKPSDWGRHLSMLSQDQDLARSIGHAARLKAKQYAIENTAHLWEKAYTS